jgi:imidazolonepropionase-like amidohydrolase
MTSFHDAVEALTPDGAASVIEAPQDWAQRGLIMLRFISIIATFCVMSFAAPAMAQERVALVGATVIDGSGGEPIADAVVVLRADRIEAVGPRASVRIPRGARVVDVSGRWITPGLIDAHVHFFQSGSLYTRPDGFDLRAVRPYLDDLNWSKDNLDTTFARYLASGVTTVVDAGGPLWNFDVRARSRTNARAPRVAIAGPLIATEPTPWVAPLNESGDPPIISAQSVDEAREMTRGLLRRRPDLIKIWGIGDGPEGAARVREITAAVAAIAHPAGVRVAVHATDLEIARAAVEGGADILVHSVDDARIDDAFIALLRERNVVYVSTIVVQEGYADALLGRPDLSPTERALGDPSIIASLYETPLEFRAYARGQADDARVAQAQANVLLLQQAGVRVAAGTDAGNIGTLHGPALHRELQLLVAAGLTPMQAIVAATRDAAYVYAPSPDVGVLRVGARADLLVLRANPTADIANLARIEAVYARGVSYAPWTLIPQSPEAIVQRQLEAYNAHDIHSFVATYAEDAEIFYLPNASTPVSAGADALRETYGEMFAQLPDLNCQVVDRLVEGNYVIDQEFCIFDDDEERAHATAIYQVENGRIRRVWFAGIQ